MTTIGIRDLKVHLSKYVAKAAAGESVVVTDRGLPVAMIGPLPGGIQKIEAMRRGGRIRWGGGKPKGVAASGAKRRGKSDPDVGGAVMEDRDR